MSQDQSIPRRNKVDWHMAKIDPILTTMRFIPQHEVVQRYGVILPNYLTNPTMKESEAYKTYHDLTTRKVHPKPKYVRRSSRTKTDEAPKPSSGKRVKSTAKKSSKEEDDDEVNVSEHDDNEQTESDNDDDDNNDEEVQGANTEEEEMVEEATHEDDEANELYRDMNVNLEGRDTVMTDAHCLMFRSSGFISNMLNPRPDTCIDSIFNTEATSLVDVPVTTIAEPPLVFATTLPPPLTPLITHMQQTPFPIPTTAPSTSLQDLPNF
ncbi:hypothetical protein Tco_0942785, partial [Tanacetum coccineum]